MTVISYLQAIHDAQRQEMRHDDRVFLMGEDVAWNMLGSSGGFVEEFGAERVRNTPITEAGFTGAAAGAAMVGMRPIVDLMLTSFMYCAMDQIVSIISKSTYLYGSQASSLGGTGIDAFTPIINPPEVAILGIGRIGDQPVSADGGIAWRKSVTLSLTVDHRAVDGAPAARFLATLADLLADPGALMT